MSGVDRPNRDTLYEYKELLLVLAMLLALVVLVVLVMRMPVGYTGSGESALTGEAVLDYRSGLLTAILTAFGAWIGAGAAYFFGTSNLKRTTEAIEKAQVSGQNRLAKIMVRDMKLDPIDRWFAHDETLKELEMWLDDKADVWWFPVVDEAGSLDTTLHEESYYRFYRHNIRKNLSDKDIGELRVKDLVSWMRENPKWRPVLWDISIPASMEMNLASLNAAMIDQDVHIAIVVDKAGHPTQAVTGGSIKSELEKC